jgi:hypothetical protein
LLGLVAARFELVAKTHVNKAEVRTVKLAKHTSRIGKLIVVSAVGAATLACMAPVSPAMAQPGRHHRREGRLITFSGRVVNTHNIPDALRVRTREGVVYLVHTRYASDFRLHEHVTVTGRANGTEVWGATVTRR